MNSTSLLGKEWSNYTELYEKHKDMLFINANIIYNIVLPESNKKYIEDFRCGYVCTPGFYYEFIKGLNL